MKSALTFDHLVCAVPDVAAGSAILGAALGIEPTFGGVHQNQDTCNVLFSLGEGRYFELLGPDPAVHAKAPFALRAAALTTLDIWTFAVATDDIDALATQVRALGIPMRGPTAGSRQTPAGDVLRWRVLFLDSPEFKGLAPFAIEWQTTPHPSQTSAQGVVLQSMVVTHSNAEALRALYAALELDLVVHYGARSAIVATLTHGERTMTLLGSGDGIS
jgi:hypothetical protein